MKMIVSTTGHCMKPYIGEGEYFLVELGAFPKCRGDLVLIDLNGEKKLHRWMGQATKGDRIKRFDLSYGTPEIHGTATHRWVGEKEVRIIRAFQKVQFALSYLNQNGNPFHKVFAALLIAVGWLFRCWERKTS